MINDLRDLQQRIMAVPFYMEMEIKYFFLSKAEQTEEFYFV